MTAHPTGKKAVTPEAAEHASHEKAHWLIEQAGELGITDDMDTRWHMLDAYCDDQQSKEISCD